MTQLQLTSSAVRRFFERYLMLDTGKREHLTVLFFDASLPSALLDGLNAVSGTRLLAIDARRIESQAAVLSELWEPEDRYVSVHDYCTSRFFPSGASGASFAQRMKGIDYTSFEFPRFDLTMEQIALLIARYTAADPIKERWCADRFYALLGDDPEYIVEVRSGPELDRSLYVRGPSPWMEICGPVAEGDLRFAPGSELFYNGSAAEGLLYCDGAVNLLPLRSDRIEQDTCRRILHLGEHLPDDPIELRFHRGRLVDIRSEAGLGAAFGELFSSDEAFSWVVEVGIGMMESARPLIREWAAPTNEAVPGIHVGLGADPGNPLRFTTTTHLDFVAPEVQISVNGHRFFDRGSFLI